MNRKRLLLGGAALLLLFAGFSYQAFQDSLTPYVSYADARASGRTVQVAGGLQPGSSAYETDSGVLRFTLVDPESGDEMPVRYEGLKPANFEDAISIVAIGRWDTTAESMAAEKLLVKCPSKYQGIEDAETKTYE